MSFVYIILALIIIFVVIVAIKNSANRNSANHAPWEDAQRIEVNFNDDDIIQTIRDGNKIEAIKMYRALHQVDLKSAKEVVESLAFNGEASETTDDEIKDMIIRGKKIQAVKMYRELYQVDLKTAKDAVDAMARTL
jgi:ribosomal protein L7/L12